MTKQCYGWQIHAMDGKGVLRMAKEYYGMATECYTDGKGVLRMARECHGCQRSATDGKGVLRMANTATDSKGVLRMAK